MGEGLGMERKGSKKNKVKKCLASVMMTYQDLASKINSISDLRSHK